MSHDAILTLNAGSSSLKFALYAAAGDFSRPLLVGQAEGLGQQPRFAVRGGDGSLLVQQDLGSATHAQAHQGRTGKLRHKRGDASCRAMGGKPRIARPGQAPERNLVTFRTPPPPAGPGQLSPRALPIIDPG